MNMKAILFVLLALIVLACAGAPKPVAKQTGAKVYPVWVDAAFDSRSRDEIVTAVEEWDDTLNGAMGMKVVDWYYRVTPVSWLDAYHADAFMIVRLDSTDPRVSDADGLRLLGFVDEIGGRVMNLVADRLAPGMTYGVTLHEFGHLLGCPHGGSGLMMTHFYYETTQCVDAWTAGTIESLHHLPSGTLRPCK